MSLSDTIRRIREEVVSNEEEIRKWQYEEQRDTRISFWFVIGLGIVVAILLYYCGFHFGE